MTPLFAPTKFRSEVIKRNLFKSPQVKVTERAVKEFESAESSDDREGLDVDEDREGLDVDEDSKSLVVEGPGNSNSEEMIKFKQRLLDTDDKKSKKEGARKKVVDYLKNNI